jgi:hypothetical protein
MRPSDWAAALLVLPCLLLAYLASANTISQPLTITVIPQSVGGCTPGAHGNVRGRAVIANGTLQAEDGCPLVVSIISYFDTSETSCLWYTNPDQWLQNMKTVGHFNAVRPFAYWSYSLFPGVSPVMTEAQMFQLNDNLLAAAERNGFYMVITSDGPWSPPGWPAGQPSLTDLDAATVRIAQRYAGHTSTILEPFGEADQGYGWNTSVAQWYDQNYLNVRAVDANVPYEIWGLASLLGVDGYNGITIEQMLALSPHVWSGGGGHLGYHAYQTNQSGSDIGALADRIKRNGYPVGQYESIPNDTSPTQGYPSPDFTWMISRIQLGELQAFYGTGNVTGGPYWNNGYEECSGTVTFSPQWPQD